MIYNISNYFDHQALGNQLLPERLLRLRRAAKKGLPIATFFLFKKIKAKITKFCLPEASCHQVALSSFQNHLEGEGPPPEYEDLEVIADVYIRLGVGLGQ